MQCCINALKMVDIHGKITLKPLIPLETLKEFQIGIEEVWKRECSSDSDLHEVSLMNRSCHLANGSVNNHLHKEF